MLEQKVRDFETRALNRFNDMQENPQENLIDYAKKLIFESEEDKLKKMSAVVFAIAIGIGFAMDVALVQSTNTFLWLTVLVPLSTLFVYFTRDFKMRYAYDESKNPYAKDSKTETKSK
jgi:hypothetical protein